MEIPYCEVCGEAPVAISVDEAGLCEPCFEDAAYEALRDAGLGAFCCRLLRHKSGQLVHSLCLEPYGVEHDHG